MGNAFATVTGDRRRSSATALAVVAAVACLTFDPWEMSVIFSTSKPSIRHGVVRDFGVSLGQVQHHVFACME